MPYHYRLLNRSPLWLSLLILGTALTACQSSETTATRPTNEVISEEQLNSRDQFSIGNAPPSSGQQAQVVQTRPPQPQIAQQRRSDALTRNETYNAITENAFVSARATPLSTFGIDVDTAAYSNVRRFINQGQRPPVDAVRIEEMLNYFTYDYPQPKGDQPFSITTEISTAPWNPEHRLLQIGLQGRRLATEALPPSNVVFLLDVSGSMSDPNKLPLLKSSLQLMVNELDAKDRVAIVVYAGSAGLVLPSTPGNEKDKILAALNQLQAGGSTAGGAGLQLAYQVAQENFIKSGNNRIVLATDGDFNVGPSTDAALVELIQQKRDQGVFLTVLGFGQGNLQDAKMEQIADKGNGNFAYIDSLLEAKKALVKELGGTLVALAKDVKIQVAFNPKQVQSYRLIGYENRLLQSQDFDDDRKDAGELGVGHSVTALYELLPPGVKPPATPTPAETTVPVDEPPVFKDELVQVKLRYQQPQGSPSQLIEQTVSEAGQAFPQASPNLRFAASVAAFGMVLRDSAYKGDTTLGQVKAWAAQAQGPDLDGYRAEFLRLVEKSKSLL